ncbi:hypothetical protein HOE425_290095 [Hoeflea sp. EC-HK425]|jgi:hypothetical protein|nr:hypothetical protein HOE425_290095 [Hoeflea sp. EC-HK425]
MFKGRNLDQSIILLCVRWYLAYGLAAIGPAPICFFNARLSSVTGTRIRNSAYGGIEWIGSTVCPAIVMRVIEHWYDRGSL